MFEGIRRPRGRRALAAMVAAVALVATACGDDDDADARPPGSVDAAATTTAASPSPSGTVGEDDDVDRDGVVRWASDLSGSSTGATMFDPTQSRVRTADVPQQWLVYGSLLRVTPDRRLVPELAESATIVDPQTIEIALRDGVVFSDGTPFDADAVKAGIERNISVPAPRPQFRAQLDDIASIEVTGPLTLTLHLNKPSAGAVYGLLAGQETFIVSPTAVASGVDLNANPVGAGPFVLETYEPERRIVFRRNERYWNADAVRLGGIEFVHAPAGAATLNALRGGAVDMAGVPVVELPELDGTGLETGEVLSESSWLWMPICKAEPPLSDVRVRQALNYALDRDALIQLVLGGRGEPAWGLWPKGTAYYHEGLEEHYAYDPERARALLAEAGYADGFSIDVMPLPGTIPGRLAEVVQAQWAEIGVDVTIVPSSNFVNDLYVEHRADLGALSAGGGGLNQLMGPYGPSSIGNLCNYENPELLELMTEISGVAEGSDEAIELWHEAQEIVVRDALSVFGAFVPSTFAWDPDRVGDVTFMTHGGGISAVPDFTAMYAKRT